MAGKSPWERVRTNPVPVSSQYSSGSKERYLISTCSPSPAKLFKSIVQEEAKKKPTIEVDLYISSEEEKTRDGTEAQQTKLKEFKKTNVKEFKSVEFISSSDEDDVNSTPKINTAPGMIKSKLENILKKKRKELHVRSAISIDALKLKKTKQQCKFILKKGVKKGELCPQWQKSDLCSTHRSKINTEIKKPQLLHDQTIKCSNPSVQESLQKLHVKLNEIETKIEQLAKQNKSTTDTVKIIKFRKLHKKGEYKLLKYLNGKAVLTSNRGEIMVKIPSKMIKPKVEENYILKFDEKTNMFQWVPM